jgi:MFS family permease
MDACVTMTVVVTFRSRPLPFFYGWIVVAVSFVTMAIAVNARTAFSLFFPEILAEFGWERGLTAGAFAFGFVVSMAFTPFLGKLMDAWSPRVLMPFGTLMLCVGLGLGTLIRQPWHLYMTLGLLVAGGTIIVGYTGHSLFLTNWFIRQRGAALGLAFSGVGIGSIVMLPWLQSIIVSAGWRAACWWLVVILLVVCVPLNAALQRTRPQDIGLVPDGDEAAARKAATGAHADNVVDREWASVNWTLGRAMRTARFWWVAVGFFSSLFVWYAIQVHQTKYLIDIGYDPTVAAFALGLVGLLGVVSQIGLGVLSDRIGREWIWSLSSVGFIVCCVLLLIMPYHPTPALLYAMVASQGLLGHGMGATYAAIPAELFQGKHYAAVFSVLSVASGLGSGLGPWMAGAVYDRTGSYAPTFSLLIAVTVLSILAIWRAAPRKVRAVAGRIRRS